MLLELERRDLIINSEICCVDFSHLSQLLAPEKFIYSENYCFCIKEIAFFILFKIVYL